MSSRDDILAAVRHAKPAAIDRPQLDGLAAAPRSREELITTFIASAESAGARVIQTARDELRAVIAAAYPALGRRVSAIEDAVDENALPHSFSDADLFICEGVLGVAENGAVWLPLSRLRYRSAVFLATNVVLVLDGTRIVSDFHAAYGSIDVRAEGFGVFVAGPSKTADIEQSLVIGAHGAKSLTIALVS
ncbi:MAG: LUD domain-containing protein [bacterium]